MKVIIKNKFFIILLAVLIVLMSVTNVFASFDFKYNDVSYSYPDLPIDLPTSYNISNFVIFHDAGNRIYISFLDTNFHGNVIYDNSSLYYSNSDLTFYSYSLENNIWKFLNSTDCYRGANFTFLYSSFNIYNSSGNVVFLAPPQGIIISQVEEIPQMMEGVLQVIIPIGLVILLSGLLILVIRSVISRLT